MKNSTTLLSAALLSFLLIAGTAAACPASYVLQQASDNQGTDLYVKATEVASKYLHYRGMHPNSPAGEITRPYVIGTAIVEHNLTQNGSSAGNDNENIDLTRKTVDENVERALGEYAGQLGQSNLDRKGHKYEVAWQHFNRHFGNGIHASGTRETQLDSAPHAG